MRNGVRLLYLGSGVVRLRGTPSGLVYHVSAERRDVVAHQADVDVILRKKGFILAP